MQYLKRKIKFLPGSLVIDCGSGNGWLAKEHTSAGVTVVSVDLSETNHRRIRREYDPEGKGGYIVADLYNLPFKDEVFGGAAANDVYEHLEEPVAAAREAGRCLKKRSSFYVSVPYKEKIIYYLCIHCNEPTPVNAHLHSFDERSLGQVFHEAGFSVSKKYRFINKALSVTFFYYAICRWMPYWLWRAIDVVANVLIRKQSRLALKVVRD